VVAKASCIVEQLHLSPESRVDLFGVAIDAIRMDQAVRQVFSWIDEPSRACRYVVTPNADHTIMLQEHQGLREAYRDADLVLADGFPVILASRLLGRSLPERVAGSDLVPALFDAADPKRPLRTFLLGAAPGVADRASERIEASWPGVEVVGTYSPPFGFEHDEIEQERMLTRVRTAQPDILVVGLGAPKQEIWVHEHSGEIAAPVVLCVGATIDFLAGERSRAPRWLQRIHLEWFYRMMGEPRRLFWRYAKDAWVFPQLVWREWRALPGGRKPAGRKPFQAG
jgi:N-acetylglucosaminyldiphosphoundecaprenol N-acetyl-beta-D-mannosaminyltransferase